jgi:arabinofuranan 3-O-arabinosyltransferase
VVVLASVVGMVPLWQRSLVQTSLSRRDVPDYWLEAAALVDERDDGTRVMAIPGSDFASYRWGNTVDPILPGLIERPFVARELVPYGTPMSADLLNALDLRLQERTLEDASLAPIARLLRVGDLVVRGDLQYERYHLARPRMVWQLVKRAPGLGEPVEMTGPYVNRPPSRLPMQDEVWLLEERDLPDGPAVAVVDVDDVPGIVDVKPASGAVLLSGDGAGMVDAAGAGVIDGTELIRYSASLDAAEVAIEMARGASLVVTDGNRDRGERWGSLRHTRGHTERIGEEALAENLTDNRLPRFPEAGYRRPDRHRAAGRDRGRCHVVREPDHLRRRRETSAGRRRRRHHGLVDGVVQRRPRRAVGVDLGRALGPRPHRSVPVTRGEDDPGHHQGAYRRG